MYDFVPYVISIHQNSNMLLLLQNKKQELEFW